MSTSNANTLQVLNSCPRDDIGRFDDSFDEKTKQRRHDYYLGKKKISLSVTGLVHRNFPPFDADKIANMLEKKNFGKYAGLKAGEIKRMWSQSAELGTHMHLQIELFYNFLAWVKEVVNVSSSKSPQTKQLSGVEDAREHLGSETLMQYNKPFLNFQEVYDFHLKIKPLGVYDEDLLTCFDEKTSEFQQFVTFYNDFKDDLVAHRTEMVVFHEELCLAGSIDMLFRNKDGYLVIGDWKRTIEFKEKGFNKGKGDLAHLEDTNLNHYTLQLNVYKRILEEKYNEKVAGLYLIRFHPETPEYEVRQVALLDKEVDAIFLTRKMEVEALEAFEGIDMDSCDVFDHDERGIKRERDLQKEIKEEEEEEGMEDWLFK